jgi:hypothetical protein
MAAVAAHGETLVVTHGDLGGALCRRCARRRPWSTSCACPASPKPAAATSGCIGSRRATRHGAGQDAAGQKIDLAESQLLRRFNGVVGGLTDWNKKCTSLVTCPV